MHEALTPRPFPSWDDFRFFLATSKAGSFSRAAGRLGVTQPTISRRIESLEQQLGLRLFERLPGGVALTAEGEEILGAARHIEQAVSEIQRRVLGTDKHLKSPVRISVTDGLATYWLTPHLPQLRAQHPDISIKLLCSLEPADLLHLEADLSLEFRRPAQSELVAVKLATLHFLPWASRDYIERHGTPTSPEELLHHRLLDHAAYCDDDGDWRQWLALARAANLMIYETNSSASLVSAVESGLGIGLMATYTCEIYDNLVPLDLGLRTHSHVWLVYRRGAKSQPRIRAVIDWLKGLFDASLTPWFTEEYHPPKVPGPKAD